MYLYLINFKYIQHLQVLDLDDRVERQATDWEKIFARHKSHKDSYLAFT